MRKYIGFMAIIFVTSIILGACSGSNNDETASNNANNNQEEEVNASSQDNSKQTDNNENSDEKPRSERIGEDEWKEDETGVGIGDTAINDSNLGEAELTLDSVELVDEDELEEDTDVTQIVAANITIKNVGENAFSPADVLYDGELYEKGEKFGTEWDYYDGVSEEWEDELQPDKETSGVIVFDNWDSDAYELVFGDKTEGLGNRVSFEFEKGETD